MPKYERIKKICSLAVLGNNSHSKQDDSIQTNNFRLPSKCKEYEEKKKSNIKSDVRSTIITYAKTRNTKTKHTVISENGNCQPKNTKDDLPPANKKHNKDTILPVEQSTEIMNIQSEKRRLYEDKDMSAAVVPNLANIFENQNGHLDEVTEDTNYLPPPHQQLDFTEMRNVGHLDEVTEDTNYLPLPHQQLDFTEMRNVGHLDEVTEDTNYLPLPHQQLDFMEMRKVGHLDEVTEDTNYLPLPQQQLDFTEMRNVGHLDDVTEDTNYVPPPHQQLDFTEMRNVTPSRITNENFNCQSINNNDYLSPEKEKYNNYNKDAIPPVEEHNHFSIQLEEDRFVDDGEMSAAVTNFENIPQTPNFQLDEVTEDEITVPPPAKKKRIKDPGDRLKVSKEKHPMGAACHDKCIRKCTENITEEHRQTIWDSYWNMDIQRRRDFISRNVENNKIAIRYSNSTKRNHTYTYKLLNHHICKTMFLRTLGYTNDQAVLAVLKANFKISKTPVSAKVSAAPDLRGRHKPKHSFSDEYLKEIDDFIELFHPASSHYRLEHAPNRRYLPTGLTLTQMFLFLKNHLERKNKQPCSWSAFHKRIKMKNISTQQPVQDKCPKCEAHDVAHPKPKLPRDESLTEHSCHECNCEVCIQYPQHLDNKNISRAHMNADSKDAEEEDSGIAIFTVDMQKCITMPQLNNKDFFFSRKLNLFNETFAGIGKGNKPATAMLWHEGESGRKAFDVATAYVLFLKTYCRDYKTVILYADNCNAQNKNKILYSALLRLINDCCNEIKTIKIEYLEPGHTYMSADSVHGAITNKMNKSGNLYDLDDYVHIIKKSRKNLTSHVHDHKEVMLFKSELKCVFPRNYNISSFKIVEFRRGKPKLFVKNNYQATDFKELDILSKAFKKEIMNTVGKEVDMFINVARRTEAEGISKIKKEDLNKLLKFMPNSRHRFYEDLVINQNITEDLDESASETFT